MKQLLAVSFACLASMCFAGTTDVKIKVTASQ